MIETIGVVYELTKRTEEKVFADVGHNNTKHFQGHPTEKFEKKT